MNLDLPDVAVDFARVARDAIAAAGGVDVARAAESDPETRSSADELLDRLGVGDLDPRADVTATLVAAELCRVAGGFVLPLPLAGRLLAIDGRQLALAPGRGATVSVDHGDRGEWIVATIDGSAWLATAGVPHRAPLAPFVADVAIGAEADPVPARDVALWLTLEAHVVLGAVEQAFSLSVAHLKDRRQFGVPLSTFQALRFRVAECAVELDGVRELGYYTAWRLHAAPAAALVDALSLRVSVQDAARRVFREAHLFHGAVGFCDEHDLSILSRHVQPDARLPWDREASLELLVEHVERDGFETLYGDLRSRRVASTSIRGSRSSPATTTP